MMTQDVSDLLQLAQRKARDYNHRAKSFPEKSLEQMENLAWAEKYEFTVQFLKTWG